MTFDVERSLGKPPPCLSHLLFPVVFHSFPFAFRFPSPFFLADPILSAGQSRSRTKPKRRKKHGKCFPSLGSCKNCFAKRWGENHEEYAGHQPPLPSLMLSQNFGKVARRPVPCHGAALEGLTGACARARAHKQGAAQPGTTAGRAEFL